MIRQGSTMMFVDYKQFAQNWERTLGQQSKGQNQNQDQSRQLEFGFEEVGQPESIFESAEF